MKDNTVEQINPPVEPGLYEMRWTHGKGVMKEWRKYEVVEFDGCLFVSAHPTSKMLPGDFVAGSGRTWGMTSINHYTGAEWRKVEEPPL